MPDRREIVLGGGQHTLYSDEVWYLVKAADSGEVVVEARFQSDAPDRTGYPTWAWTELCVSRAGEEAVGRLHYAGPAEFSRRPARRSYRRASGPGRPRSAESWCRRPRASAEPSAANAMLKIKGRLNDHGG